jgi:hypothetical protein
VLRLSARLPDSRTFPPAFCVSLLPPQQQVFFIAQNSTSFVGIFIIYGSFFRNLVPRLMFCRPQLGWRQADSKKSWLAGGKLCDLKCLQNFQVQPPANKERKGTETVSMAKSES